MLLIDLAAIVALFILGALLAKSLAPRAGLIRVFAIAFPLGAGGLAWLLFFFSWIGVPYNRPLLVTTTLSLILAAAWLAYIRRQRLTREEVGKWRAEKFGSADLTMLLIVGVIWIGLSWLSVQRSYSTWDAIVIWGLKGLGFAERGTIIQPLGAYGLSYPINIPMQISFFRLLSGDAAPGSKLLFPPYQISMVLGVYVFLKGRRKNMLGIAGALLLGTIPILVEHATIAYANLPFTAYLALGLIALYGGLRSDHKGEQFLGGLLLGLGSWTRPEGVFVILPMLLVMYISRRVSTGAHSTAEIVWLTPPLAFIAIWQLFMGLNGHQGFFGNVLGIAMESFRAGDQNLTAFYWTARYAARQLIDPTVWGLIVPVGLVATVLRWRSVFSKENFSLSLFILPALAAVVMLFAYYYIASFRQEIHYLLGTSVNRLFMPAWVLGILGILGSVEKRQ